MNNNVEVVPAVIIIPDMSGFTQFVKYTNIDFTVKVIPQLLQNIINSNVLDLKIAEIQGDAVIFYKEGKAPSINEICKQCTKFFIDFDHSIRILEEIISKNSSNYEPTSNLGLKMVVHYGNISITHIGGIKKLIGEDVIIAHRLLKNNIDMHDYMLLSEKYLNTQPDLDFKDLFTWSELKSGFDEYKHIGKINYKYVSLQPLERLNPTARRK